MDRREDVMAQATAVEFAQLERLGLRWAVLAAWANQMLSRKVTVPPPVAKQLDEARLKLSSGCFSSCDVTCSLSGVEAALVMADGSTADPQVDYWLGLVGASMAEDIDTAALLGVAAVKIHYSSCFDKKCNCGA